MSKDFEHDLDDELQFHLEMEARKLRESGMSEEAARRRARAEFGGVEQRREECRDLRWLTALENLARDVRYGLRMLRKSPVFTAIAVLSLAIGIGANTAVFTLVNAVLLRMLPVKNPEQLVVLKWGAHKEPDLTTAYSTNGPDVHGRQSTNVFSWRTVEALRQGNHSLDSVIGFAPLWQVSVAGNKQALVTDGAVVTGNYFSTLGVPAAVGRLLESDNDIVAGTPALVISYHLWETQFGLAPDVIGKTLYINTQPCTIMGVTPKSFLGLSTAHRIDLMLPVRARPLVAGATRQRLDYFFAQDFYWLQAVGRRHPGASDAAIEAEAAAAVEANLPETARRSLAGESPYVSAERAGQGLSGLRESYRNPLLIVMGVVAITLLMACANLAGLLLARANTRGREITVRLALGAGRGRLIRQLLVEGALLSAAGAISGIVIAWAGLRALLALMNSGWSMPLEAAPDGWVLAFTIAVSLVTTLLFALAPAVRATGVDVAHGLKQETPTVSGPRLGAVRVLVVAQVAVALPLVAGAILMSRTLANLRSVPVGFNPGNVVLFDLAPAQSGYDEVRAEQLFTRVLDNMRQTPGVVGATAAFERLLSGYSSNGSVRIEGRTRGARSSFNFVGPNFFETMQIPLVEGRTIGDRDMAGPKIAVVNEAFVQRHFRGASPLGRRFRWGREQNWDVEIVGVVRDTLYDRIRGELPPIVYAPYTQSPWGWPQKLSVAVRIAGGQAAGVTAVRSVMSGIDRALPLMDVKTQKAQIDELLVQERLFAWLIGLFGSITLALACVGIYGMVAASVAARTREIGVRMALGAGRGSVLRMVLGQVAVTAGAGLAIGLAAAWASTRIVESRLFGVKAHDPLTLVLAATGVLLIASGAASLPAWRAMRIEPVRALRYE
jgi:macrolide transport system ATP-binding/permease protein